MDDEGISERVESRDMLRAGVLVSDCRVDAEEVARGDREFDNVVEDDLFSAPVAERDDVARAVAVVKKDGTCEREAGALRLALAFEEVNPLLEREMLNVAHLLSENDAADERDRLPHTDGVLPPLPFASIVTVGRMLRVD